MDTVAPQRFEEIENLYCGSVYPGPPLWRGSKTALCLFTAEWLGMQDVYWLAKAGVTGTCVDLKGDKLSVMEGLYPDGWEFVEADAYEFTARAEENGEQWDLVNLDPWCGQFDACAKLIDRWAALARKVIVLGHGNYRLEEPAAPAGWSQVEKITRSSFRGGVHWLVFARD